MPQPTVLIDPEKTPSGLVDADLTFIVPPTDGSSAFIDIGAEHISHEETYGVPLTDIRGEEHLYEMSTDVFKTIQNVPSETTYETFDSESEIGRVYYPEVEKLLLQTLPGAHKVMILGHGVRRQNKDDNRQPILFVHSDHTAHAAEKFVRQHADPETAEGKSLLNGRFRIYSVWKPLNGTVQSMPLAFASASVDNDTDIFTTELRYPDGHLDWFTGVRYNPRQRWLYWSGMENDERLLLKCTDNASGVAKQAFHTAFADPRFLSEAKPRESIETRALVFG